MTPETIRRAAAVAACKARFEGTELDYSARRDCIRLTAHAFRAMGKATPLLKGVDYRSEVAAARALKRLGFANLVEAMDATGLVRIAPAATWPADIVAGPSGRDGGPFRWSLSVVHEYAASRTLAFGPTPDGPIICGVGTPDLSHPDVIAWRLA